ncbi:hypothetical protein QTG56_22945 (plasmid) [Rossellomorea sp. AcN35-11]|nr:hypothetical protein [Rossellomorea aquimaris]WJV32226.1 hypothetical protein QTG56_22945 [Rossellomorea sp. AcN35-11]
MQITDCLYLFDFFPVEDLEDTFPEVIFKEVNELHFANKLFILSVEEEVDFFLEIGIYEGKNGLLSIESHMYAMKNGVSIEEYDLVYFRKYHDEALTLVNFAIGGIKLTKAEISKQNLPIRIFDTTKTKYKVAKTTTENDVIEALEIIEDFEAEELPGLLKYYDEMAKQENDRLAQIKEGDSQEAEKLIAKLLEEHYRNQIDKALIEKNEDKFLEFSELYIYHKNMNV